MNTIDRLPPQNIEAEQAVLGSMLLSREAIYSVIEILKADDFYKETHRSIYKTILTLQDEGHIVDIVTVSEKLASDNLFEKTGGPLYLAELSDSVPTAANAEYYARIVAEKSMLRRIISAATIVAQKGYDNPEEPIALLEEAERMFFELGQGRRRGTFQHINDVLKETFENLGRMVENSGGVSGVPTFLNLDKYLSGLQQSDLLIVAARPGMGKTSFCLNIALRAAMKHNVTSAIFSLEMSAEQLVQRLLGSEAMVDISKLRSGFISEENDWPRLVSVAGAMSKAPLYIDDTPGISVMEMRAKTRRLKAEANLGLVIVDYIQLMQGSKKTENRQQEISEISRSLKALARELKVPVMALSQLSRAVEQTQDKKPNLSHLRESGALEQDADIVLFIHRPEYFDKENPELKGLAEIIVAKHRNGPTGTADLGFFSEFTKFVDLEK